MRCVIAFILLLGAVSANAVIETYEFSNPSLEARYRQLGEELRCPKCQNQNIADSNAPISRDLRNLLHKQLEAGASDEEILDFMVARYGEFVRYRPAVDQNTLLLWYAPGILIAAGLVGLFIHLRGHNHKPQPAGLSEEERDMLAKRIQDHK